MKSVLFKAVSAAILITSLAVLLLTPSSPPPLYGSFTLMRYLVIDNTGAFDTRPKYRPESLNTGSKYVGLFNLDWEVDRVVSPLPFLGVIGRQVRASIEIDEFGRREPFQSDELQAIEQLVRESVRLEEPLVAESLSAGGPVSSIDGDRIVTRVVRTVAWFGAFGGMLVLAVKLMSYVRASEIAARRRERGACPKCGYPAIGLERCPECGHRHDAMGSKAVQSHRS